MAEEIPFRALGFVIIFPFTLLLVNGAAMSSWNDPAYRYPQMPFQLSQYYENSGLGIFNPYHRLLENDVACRKRNGTASLGEFVNNLNFCISQKGVSVLNNFGSTYSRFDDGYRYQKFCQIGKAAFPCFNEYLKSIDDCWGLEEKDGMAQAVLTETLQYFCGKDNSAKNIILFAENNGLGCFMEHRTDFLQCFKSRFDISNLQDKIEQIYDPSKQKRVDYCARLGRFHECAFREFRKCENSIPENVITSWLKRLGRALDCNASAFSGSQSNFAVKLFVLIPLFLATFKVV